MAGNQEIINLNPDLLNYYLDLIGELEGTPVLDSNAPSNLFSKIESDNSLNKVDQALLQGYLGYHFKDNLPQVDCEAEFIFVLEQEPENQWAIYFLGCHYFDHGCYSRALDLFQKINLESCSLWSKIKMRELIVSCYLHLNEFRKAEGLLLPLLHESNTASTEDYALPIELMQALVEWHGEFSIVIGIDLYHQIIKLLDTVLKKHDLTSVFRYEMALLVQS